MQQQPRKGGGPATPQMPHFDTTREVSKRAARLERELLANMARTSRAWGMIEPGDHIMVAISGGKDSYTLLHLLRQLQRRVPFGFTFTAVNLDQGHPGYPVETLRSWLVEQGYRHHIEFSDTYSIVTDKIDPGNTYCPLCSRLRRGILYRLADELGCNKIALGHHRDDLIETLLLNAFFSGQLKAMAPRLLADNGRHVVIRPMAQCAEEDIALFSRLMEFPILPCDLCGSQDNLQRQEIKGLIARLSESNPKLKGNLVAALGRVRPTHLLDRDLLVELATGDDRRGAARSLASAPSPSDSASASADPATAGPARGETTVDPGSLVPLTLRGVPVHLAHPGDPS